MAHRSAARTQARRAGRARRTDVARSPALKAAQRRAAILGRLSAEYPDAKTALEYETPFQLLVAVILSAQCTDKRVNIVTPTLFAEYPTVEKMARARVRDVERFIKTCGLYHGKARNIVRASRAIVERFGGEVPASMEDLLTLPGVGRKTANVIRSVAFQREAIAVDTHVQRVTNRLGLVKSKSPRETERQLERVVPRKDWAKAHHWLIFHGRRVCHARNPACARCVVVDLCPSAKKFLKPA